MLKKKLKNLFSLIDFFATKMRDDHLPSFSAHAAFFVIVSFFPFIMFLLTMFKYLPFSEATLLSLINQYLPASISSIPIAIVRELYSDVSGAFVSITVLTTLWSASKGFYAIMQGMNAIYRIRETRNIFHLLLLSSIYTFTFAGMILVTMGILVFGNQIFNTIVSHYPWFEHFRSTADLIQHLFPPVVLILFFLCLFRAIPNQKSTIKKELPGAVFAALGWIIFSRLYSFYIDNMGSLSNTYGSLTAVILFMLWLYFCMYILFIGSELNVFLRDFRKSGKKMSVLIEDHEKRMRDHLGS